MAEPPTSGVEGGSFDRGSETGFGEATDQACGQARDRVGSSDSLRLESLLAWGSANSSLKSLHDRLIADPAYPAAARAFARNLLAATSGRPMTGGLFKDAGRYIVAMCAIYLHVSGGLTLARLKALCADSGLVSPGRARAILLYLQYLGYVELLPDRFRGAASRFAPTAKFLHAWRAQLSAALGAVGLIEPAVDLLARRIAEPEIFGRFSKTQIEALLAAAHGGVTETAFSRIFMHRNAGTQLVWTLVAASDGAFPPTGQIPFRLAVTARVFDVSVMHLRRILRDAQAAGLLTWDPAGHVTFEEAGRAEIQFMYAGQLLHLLTAAARTMAETFV